MAKTDNLKDFLTDVADAIREKTGESSPINPQDFSQKILDIKTGGGGASRPSWTGHADVEGLKAIGWTDEDIAYYQQNGVNWNEEDDEYHKVTDDNKALYGVLTANNISTYKDRIVYLPKIDTSAKTDMVKMFDGCRSLVSIPLIDTSAVTKMNNMFKNCYSLVTIPLLDTSKVADMSYMFNNCRSLEYIPLLNTGKVKYTTNMCQECWSLKNIPPFEMPTLVQMNNMFYNCYSLENAIFGDSTHPADTTASFYNCRSLVRVHLSTSTTWIMASEMFYNCNSLLEFSFGTLALNDTFYMSSMFNGCSSLVSAPLLPTSKFDSSMKDMFNACHSLVNIPEYDVTTVTSFSSNTFFAYSLQSLKLKGLRVSLTLTFNPLISKDSILYIINNEAATKAITINLAAYAYTRLSNDTDIVAALANHPNISLASA